MIMESKVDPAYEVPVEFKLAITLDDLLSRPLIVRDDSEPTILSLVHATFEVRRYSAILRSFGNSEPGGSCLEV
tara:strand:- start:166 stop:387 length:222 start_codon:yes stop_codon:yes gene_type:complete